MVIFYSNTIKYSINFSLSIVSITMLSNVIVTLKERESFHQFHFCVGVNFISILEVFKVVTLLGWHNPGSSLSC